MRFIANLQGSRDVTRDGLWAGCVAAIVSGAPSTLIAIRHKNLGGYAREAIAGAAAVAGARRAPPPLRWVAAGLAHAALSLAWAGVMAVALPRRRTVLHGAGAGLAIAAFDLGVVGRRIPEIRRLDLGPQVLDHLAFGVSAAAVIAGRRSGRRSGRR